jgi:chloride channel protein, CIC family
MLDEVAYRDLIGLVRNVLFLGQFSFRYDANLFTPSSPWGPLVSLVPVIGAVGVTFLVTSLRRRRGGMAYPRSWTPFTTGAASSVRSSPS